MKATWLGMTLLLPLLTACDVRSDITINSTQISEQQANTIKQNITSQYPNVSAEEKQQIADVAVKAIENLVFVEGGSFDMGDFKAPCEIPSGTANRIDWSPEHKCFSGPSATLAGAMHLHKVTLDSYSIAKIETTFPDMEVMRKVNDLPVAYQKLDGSPYIRGTDEYIKQLQKRASFAAPAKNWQDAKDYCLWLGRVTTLPFDLPTEAQWEYAARSRGQHYYFATNNGYRQLREGSYYSSKTGYWINYIDDEVNASTNITTVDTFPANPLGVYGMSNQVSEWVNDWYAKDYYLHSPEHNPQGPETGTEKVQRDGGGVTMTFSRLHSPGEKKYYLSSSFRCALQQPLPAMP
ncbi:SUMF1/EgtB/PvdO family nonheme iron enzyme [Vibrio sp. CK2-1]|uniref:formylglycine-generating enzyme family protein n=1 Tax=Vibrio sp. CK2-1 TaxID=2912249 RepID=UPI001F241DC7|nr:SUMF1/EgtB/PvdO family nonheme iron enzyme [Vibrio sp. CK2-1]MCF7352897.1 formylglycine-generating enzyme family protein [Vibrio sp. CK2-1]